MRGMHFGLRHFLSATLASHACWYRDGQKLPEAVGRLESLPVLVTTSGALRQPSCSLDVEQLLADKVQDTVALAALR